MCHTIVPGSEVNSQADHFSMAKMSSHPQKLTPTETGHREDLREEKHATLLTCHITSIKFAFCQKHGKFILMLLWKTQTEHSRTATGLP